MSEIEITQVTKGLSTDSQAKQGPGGLKIITWIMAYAVWIFIFLIPVIGLIWIVAVLLKNRPSSKDIKPAA